MQQLRAVLSGLAIASLSFTIASNASAARIAAGAVGSANVAVADPTVPRPPSTPCVVQLFSNDTFDDFNTRPFSYAPPAACPGKWSKVVLEADFSVTAGIQFDRTATIFLDGVNLYFGTTQEPSPTLAPSWHVERDLTDYTALFTKAGQGQADIGNIVNSQYTGVIHGSARLLFYPATSQSAAKVADQVIPLGSDPVGSTVLLGNPDAPLARTLTLPHNVERAYLDVFAQSQNADEFWYTCVPNRFAAEVQECGGGNFREVEVNIDGVPAGVAPVYPWIYTGGIDFFMWEPTPGVQTLNFMPYRVDLTPYAGVLSNGKQHHVAVHVAGANNYFSATAALLVYLDPNSTQINGQIVTNTLAAQPAIPTIGSNLQTDSSGDVSGDITTDLSRNFVIEGYADTSHGRLFTKVTQTVSFDDTQTFTINASTYHQISDQITQANSVSQTLLGGQVFSQYQQDLQYPLHVDFNEQVAGDGSVSLASAVRQGYVRTEKRGQGGATSYSSQIGNTISAADTLDFDSGFNYLGHSGQRGAQSFSFNDSLGGCYAGSVASVNGIVTSQSQGNGCSGLSSPLWYTHPDGSPDNVSAQLGW